MNTAMKVVPLDHGHDHFEIQRVDDEIVIVMESRGTFTVKCVLAVSDALRFAASLTKCAS